ncbi:MAG TPA: CHRD domain-containing protein [Jiangellaceae bacterium]
MPRHRRIAIAVAVLSLVSTAGLGTVAAADSDTAGIMTAQLSGAEEVPAVDTNAHGVAVFKRTGEDELTFFLNVANIENVSMSHIHLAPAGQNGGVVVWLYPSAPPPQLIPGRFDGPLASGTITSANLVGALAGKTVQDLVDNIEAGNAYVNVHTSQFPGGEIRGQIAHHGP